jgi:hypothetical protein
MIYSSWMGYIRVLTQSARTIFSARGDVFTLARPAQRGIYRCQTGSQVDSLFCEGRIIMTLVTSQIETLTTGAQASGGLLLLTVLIGCHRSAAHSA